MTTVDSGDKSREGLLKLVEDLEYHRSVEVDARLERAIRIEMDAASAGALDLQMRARLVQADMQLRTGHGTAAARLAVAVNRWATEQGPLFLQARSHLILSSVFESVGDSASCLDHALCAIELLDADTAPRTRGNFLLRLADALSVAGSFDAARERYREAERLFVSVGDIERQINVLNNMAYSEYETGDVHRAWAAAQEMQNLADRSGYALSPPLLDTLARAHIGLGEYDEAAVALEAAIEQLELDGDVQAVTPAELMLTLVDVQRSQGRVEAARKTLDRCREVCRQRNLLGVEVELLRVQAELGAAAGQFEQAYEAHRVFHTEYLKLNSARREANARTRQALFETAEARQEAQRFWRQARTDSLTGLPNRRFVDEEIPRRLNEFVTGTPLVVAIVDVDHFKRVNDTMSHAVGDRVICELGRLLEDAISASTAVALNSRFVARLGGEEFLVALSGLERSDATAIIEGLRSAVDRHHWRPMIGSLPLTVSIGVSAAIAKDTESTLLARADHNLYAAKAAGRNRVVFEENPDGGPSYGSADGSGLGTSLRTDRRQPRP